jgi:hypothetical protein
MLQSSVSAVQWLDFGNNVSTIFAFALDGSSQTLACRSFLWELIKLLISISVLGVVLDWGLGLRTFASFLMTLMHTKL